MQAQADNPGELDQRSVWTAVDLMGRIDQHIEASCTWLRESMKVSGDKSGWGLGQGYQWDEIVPWGGTIDAVRALFAARGCRPEFKKAAEDLLTMRRKDHGWGLHYADACSSVEPTAWALVLLNEIEVSVPEDAIGFLLTAQDKGSGGWGSQPQHPPRIYPTLLAVWAISNAGHHEKADAGLQWLFRQQQRGGFWYCDRIDGSSPHVGSVALTAQILCVLRSIQRTRLLPEAERRIIEWLETNTPIDGLQEEVEYYKIHDASVTENPHIRHFSTAWALLALDATERSPLQSSTFLALARQLVTMQNDGVWRIPPDSSFVRTYFVAHGLLALLAIRRSLQKCIWLSVADELHRGAAEVNNRVRQLSEHLQMLDTRASRNESRIATIEAAAAEVEKRRRQMKLRRMFVAGLCTAELALVAIVLWSSVRLADIIPSRRLPGEPVPSRMVASALVVASQLPVLWLLKKLGRRSSEVKEWKPFEFLVRFEKWLRAAIVTVVLALIAGWVARELFGW